MKQNKLGKTEWVAILPEIWNEKPKVLIVKGELREKNRQMQEYLRLRLENIRKGRENKGWNCQGEKRAVK